MTIEVLVNDSPHVTSEEESQIESAIQRIASDYGWASGQISVAIVDDEEIHQVNQQYLQHDYPTDVISFDLTEPDAEHLEGEIIVSWQTATRVAKENGWHSHQELLLYTIHGMLHIVGLDDGTTEQVQEMRKQERHYMLVITGDASNCQN
ncbi:MAG: rRNA maturation RNase YbeY [Pirellula sp.]|jgi:probable rRNA maturation factor|nr:rRNA maturation RNase YbeY [Pirellula sp.]